MIYREFALKKFLLAVSAFVALASTAHAADALEDGPYISVRDNGAWIASQIVAGEVRQQSVRLGQQVLVPGVGSLPQFAVELRAPSGSAADEVPLRKTTPLFVVADTHGEFEIAVGLLKAHHIIDAKLDWSFGKGHLVLLGDVFDRGAHQTELLWLIYKLEAQAQRAGGAVHLLLGNHETMVLLGDERYLNPKYKQTAAALGVPRYAALWNERSLLGQWLRTKAAVMKIGDYLCAHGGISPHLAAREFTLKTVNEIVRDALHARHRLPPTPNDPISLIMGPTGPLWYRGYFVDSRHQGGPAQATGGEVQHILDFYKAKKIFVGHTRVDTVTPLYDRRVMAIQVYPHRHPETGAPVMEALAVDKGKFFKARADGSKELLFKVEPSD